MTKIAIIGAGAWGTSLAETLSRAGRDVTLYARDTGLADTINASRENKTYLPGIPLHDKIRATADIAGAVSEAEIILFSTPSQYLRSTFSTFKPHLPKDVPLVNTAKGIEIATGKLLSEVAAEIVGDHPYAVLSGPNFAGEVAKGLPAAATLATTADAKKAMAWAELLRGKMFRPYVSSDVIGAEIAGAIKNVIAIACGIVEGKKFGQNARAAVMTRGMAEIRRYGLTRGAQADTFLGLSGIGDLNLTCSSMSSRNFSLGAEMASGKTLEAILAERRTVAEGVATAKAIAGIAKNEKIDMPICLGVDAILHHGAKVDEVMAGFFTRNIRSETE